MLDSTAAVAAERQGKDARQLLESVPLETGDEGIAVSVVAVLELAHGVGASAPELGYGVGTSNVRHFRLIPGLSVVRL